METELISVIVPVYNVERYLRRCVDSILHQTYRNLEVLLVDDGSTDASGVMPPKSATWAFFTITGTPDGGRNNLAPDNEFMVGVTAKYMEEEFRIIESQPEKEPENTADPVAEHLKALADRLEKKLAELEKTENTVEEIKKNEAEVVPESPAEKAQEVPAATQDALAAPAVDTVISQSEKVKESISSSGTAGEELQKIPVTENVSAATEMEAR